MSQTTGRIPKYSKHRASGQAVVTLDGRDFYLGPHGTAASRQEYDRRIAEWIAAGRRLPADPNQTTVAEVAAAFRAHAQRYYRDADGNLSRCVDNFDEALRPLLKLYGKTPAAEFGPLRLKAVRQAMIAQDRVRTNINRHITRLRGVFKWAVENEMIPASVHHGLMAVAGLRRGRAEAKESEPVKPVPVEHVEAVIPHVAAQVAAMIRLQRLTGMRPGEVVIMRGLDVDTTGELWVYRPSRHKNAIHGHAREIYLGPKAQDVVRPFLKLDPAAPLFSPADAEQTRRKALHAARKTPLSCGNRPGTNRRGRPQRTVGDRYNVTTYYRAIIRGCDKAFGAPPDLAGEDLAAWQKAHRWHPNQIRHTAATELRKTHGLEAAQVILGHATLSVTQVYAEKNVEAAMRIMAAVG